MKRLLDFDGVVADYWSYDEETDTATIERTTDVAPILEHNKDKQNNSDGYTLSRDMRHVATIDVVTYEMWLKEAFGEDWVQRPAKDKMEVIKRKINDPDFKYFRTISGHA